MIDDITSAILEDKYVSDEGGSYTKTKCKLITANGREVVMDVDKLYAIANKLGLEVYGVSTEV